MMESGQGMQFSSSSTSMTPLNGSSNLGPLSAANDRYLHGKIPTWNDFVASPELRRVLAEAGGRTLPEPAQGPDAERRRLVGPGGLLRAAQDLRDVGEARFRAG